MRDSSLIPCNWILTQYARYISNKLHFRWSTKSQSQIQTCFYKDLCNPLELIKNLYKQENTQLYKVLKEADNPSQENEVNM